MHFSFRGCQEKVYVNVLSAYVCIIVYFCQRLSVLRRCGISGLADLNSVRLSCREKWHQKQESALSVTEAGTRGW